MIQYNASQNKFSFHNLTASFMDEDKSRTVYTSDRNHWEKMIGKWGHLSNLSFTAVIPSDDQQSRLDEINQESVEMYSAEYSLYVEFDAIADDVESPLLQTLDTHERNENYLNVLREQLKDEARHIRWLKETSGTSVNGMSLRTDSDSQARVGNLISTLLADPDVSQIDFEVQHGQWQTVDRDTALVMAKAISQHVQACFTRCKEIHAEIDNASLEQLYEVDINNGWPE